MTDYYGKRVDYIDPSRVTVSDDEFMVTGVQPMTKTLTLAYVGDGYVLFAVENDSPCFSQYKYWPELENDFGNEYAIVRIEMEASEADRLLQYTNGNVGPLLTLDDGYAAQAFVAQWMIGEGTVIYCDVDWKDNTNPCHLCGESEVH